MTAILKPLHYGLAHGQELVTPPICGFVGRVKPFGKRLKTGEFHPPYTRGRYRFRPISQRVNRQVARGSASRHYQALLGTVFSAPSGCQSKV
jgi:hypothetical protein